MYYQGPSSDDDEEMEAVDHGGVGYRLGGDETTTQNDPSLTPAQAAAQAALRRLGSTPKPTSPTLPTNNQQTTPSTPNPATTTSTKSTSPTSSSTQQTTTSKPTSPTSTQSTTTSIKPIASAHTIVEPAPNFTQTTQNSPTSTETNPQDATNDRSCPLCGLQFQAAFTERQITQHVNSCLDKA